MTRLIANARMYAVTPQAEAAWQELLARVTRAAGLDLDYVPHLGLHLLEALWRRPDLGCVFMCGYPIALKLADVVPIAAPIPAVPWARGRAVYRSDLIVRAETPYTSLEETFGGTVGWTVEHSHSGFNALRHHLLPYRKPGHDRVFARSVGPLLAARKILDSVVDGSIDIGPLDGYWHLLMRRYLPDLLAKVRVLDSTDVVPMPAFVVSAGVPAAHVQALRRTFLASRDAPWFPALAEALCLEGFEAVDQDSYAETLLWAREAEDAGYPMPV